MPGLRALGRRWNIGSDDLILPAGLEILVSGSWLVLMVIYKIRTCTKAGYEFDAMAG